MTAPVSGPWWQRAVVYQIYPRSFCDTSGAGIGDLEGIRRHLDHVQWLGVDAIWLSPFYRSPMADFGYDVADYCDVDPVFGTLADFDGLLSAAHDAGIRVLIDWVPNHTSDQHPWFVMARSSRDSPHRDWYIWRDGEGPDGPKPNNWKAAFGGDAWTWDAGSGQWYLHSFLPEQPDLNWANPEVRGAMMDTLRFWLDRGVDGFRIDVVQCLGKDPALPDLPAELAPVPVSAVNDQPATHVYMREIRRVLDSYPGHRVGVGEVYLLSTRQVAPYYGTVAEPELHLAFNFPPLYAPWQSAAWRKRIDRVAEELDPIPAWPTWVLSNHDNTRHRTRYGSEARARAAAVLLLTLRGTPFLYAGEEFGLEDAVIPPDRRVDPGGRDGCRAPLPWDGDANHGWGAPGLPVLDAWLPWPPGAATDRNAVAQREDLSSILHLYRRLLAARRQSPALHAGEWHVLPSPDGVLAYQRILAADARSVYVNFTGEQVEVAGPDDEPWVVELSSDGIGQEGPWSGRLGPDQAVLLRRGSSP